MSCNSSCWLGVKTTARSSSYYFASLRNREFCKCSFTVLRN
ncbi:hypothetical protein HMPREF1584_00866 [Gardnerella vaginalis JCP8481A]|uniref:Uncharacterized protein n=1 Tax=Gardnerella vaginalis TaxID=2702 RepID=A0A133NYE2_GARVA|nr:hypothetical protein HMPREF1585_00779 [Gardnerella vaginalis JCP8481B]EPI42697.1 hypothetical protein HMPREF1584_00866 [Gardnerella vaginalis JCP8481A]KXA21316.1 hypothetical protein HMPREF3208_00620 [Gardnerella vaginalis]